MTYQFLRDLEEEINPHGKSQWTEDYNLFLKLMVHSGTGKTATYPSCDIKFRLRGFAELSKWWKTFGLNECLVDKHVATWDEHRYREAYEGLQMHQPFDMVAFLEGLQAATGRDLLKFTGIIIPNWKLSPDNEYWDMPNRLMVAMREVWHGKSKQNENWWVSGFGKPFRYHRCHYFPYHPEPELWMFVAMNAKPSYVKGRLYAYNAYKDMSVLEERFLHSLVNLTITKANGKKDLWTAGQQS